METVETMSTTSTTVITCMEQDEELAALSARWPQVDAHELRRLRFLAYRQATGRLRPSAPLGPIGACVCEEIAAYLRAPTPPAAPMPAGRDVSSGELRALVEACKRDTGPAGVRDRAMLAVLYIGGIRRAELAGLAVADYRREPPTLRIRHGKGDKERLVPLTAGAADALDAWLLRRGDRPGALFLPITKDGRVRGSTISSMAIYKMLRKRAAEAGVARLSPHDLRRSFVVICTNCGHHNPVDQQRAKSGGVIMPETLEPEREPI